ncbi:nucleotidyltransferase family protein [Martelella endophytica]|uniref:nucleotidyltransferase family protein n=1 Tax=Martelella endophytica TaxID=1486262 RepID=UPI000697943E|nr:nucleotidyltransferase family protein [Martelella endophytica]
MPALLEERAVIVLAAGASRRFTGGDKLLADFRGKPLVDAPLARAAELPFATRLAVVSSEAVAERARGAGLTPVMIGPGLAQSDSLKAGVAALSPTCRFALILLGDMPFVDPFRLVEIAMRERPTCAGLQGRPMPPALLPRDWFEDIFRLSGDRGAGALLARIPEQARVEWSRQELNDIDHRDQLRSAPFPQTRRHPRG